MPKDTDAMRRRTPESPTASRRPTEPCCLMTRRSDGPVALIVSVACSKPSGMHEDRGGWSVTCTSEKTTAEEFESRLYDNSRFSNAHQTANDLDGALVSSVAARADQHRQEQRDEQVFPYKRLVPIQDKRRAGLQHQESKQPPPAVQYRSSAGPRLVRCCTPNPKNRLDCGAKVKAQKGPNKEVVTIGYEKELTLGTKPPVLR